MAEWLTPAEAIAAHVHDGDCVALERFTDLCILRPNAVSRELEVASIHPGVDRTTIAESTGWAIRFSDECDETKAPRTSELDVLRDLKARTAAAHGVQGDEA